MPALLPSGTAHRVTTPEGVGLRVWELPAGGPSVLLIHGLTANARYWLPIAEALHARGCRVLAMDLRGRGESDKPIGEYTPRIHAADGTAVLRALAPEGAHVVGHSLGAVIALELAARQPRAVLRLVLMDGGGVISYTASAKAIRAIRPALERLGKSYPDAEAYVAARRALVPPVLWTPWLEAAVRYEIASLPEGGVGCNIPLRIVEAEFAGQGGGITPRQVRKLWMRRPIWMFRQTYRRMHPPYRAIRCPTRILKAGHFNVSPGDDILTDAAIARMCRAIPSATAHTFPDLNHYTLQFARHPERDRLLAEFLGA